MGKRTRKKPVQKPLRNKSSISPSAVLFSLFRSISLPFFLVPLLYGAGRTQPYLNFFIIGYFLASTVKFASFLYFEIPVSYAVATLLWSSIYNPSFFNRAVLVKDPLVYGDVILKSVFVDLLYSNANFSFFYPGITIASLFLSAIMVASGVLLSFGLKKMMSNLKLETKITDTFLLVATLTIILISYSYLDAYKPFFIKINMPVEPGQYATDYHIYKRTLELMKFEKMGYYQALHNARNQDARVIRNPLEEYPIPSPLWVRQPYLFYFWYFITSQTLDSIILVALIIFCLGLLIIAYYLEKFLFKGASFLSLLLIYPFFYLSIGWEEIFLPDLWGSLFALISFGFLLLSQDELSLFFAEIASLCRIFFAPFFVAVLFYVVWKNLHAKDYKKAIRNFFLGLIFPVLYSLHFYNVVNKHSYILTSTQTGLSLGTRFAVNLTQNLKTITWISNFLAFPYTLHIFHGIVLIFLVVFLFALRWVLLQKRLTAMDLIVIGTIFYAIAFSLSTHACQYYNATLFPFVIVSLVLLSCHLIQKLKLKFEV